MNANEEKQLFARLREMTEEKLQEVTLLSEVLEFLEPNWARLKAISELSLKYPGVIPETLTLHSESPLIVVPEPVVVMPEPVVLQARKPVGREKGMRKGHQKLLYMILLAGEQRYPDGMPVAHLEQHVSVQDAGMTRQQISVCVSRAISPEKHLLA